MRTEATSNQLRPVFGVRPLLAVALLVLSLGSGCEWHSDVRYQEDNPERMARLKLMLQEERVAFRENDDGSIEFGWSDKEKVDEIAERMSRTVGMRLDDPSERATAIATLRSLGERPREERKADGIWVMWDPESEQARELSERRVWHAIQGIENSRNGVSEDGARDTSSGPASLPDEP